MSVFFRAIVMLVTLVGLPAAWVYYGPLPHGAQKVVDRFVEVAQQALGCSCKSAADSSSQPGRLSPRPAADAETSPLIADRLPRTPDAVAPQSPGALETVSLASASMASATAGSHLSGAVVDSSLSAELEPHFRVLQRLGAVDYALETWGDRGQHYRFRCTIPLGEHDDFTRQFEAIDVSPAAAVRQVVGEVSSWQNARHATKASLSQWR